MHGRFNLLLSLTASRMGLPQDPSADPNCALLGRHRANHERARRAGDPRHGVPGVPRLLPRPLPPRWPAGMEAAVGRRPGAALAHLPGCSGAALGSKIRFPPPEKNELVLSIQMGCTDTVLFSTTAKHPVLTRPISSPQKPCSAPTFWSSGAAQQSAIATHAEDAQQESR